MIAVVELIILILVLAETQYYEHKKAGKNPKLSEYAWCFLAIILLALALIISVII